MADPIVVRSLDEIKFWSRIMKEHALFLSLGFTYEQKHLIDEARQFIMLFERIEEKVTRFSVNSDLRQVQAVNATQKRPIVDGIVCPGVDGYNVLNNPEER
ncbi:hypothetical protein JOC78_003538, partial [Bacillus ectoiniformans]|uniref:DUF2935 domain-containing protein n=1 Tax=Bacillus ectoiniformans TaxID=1494429 RepID=UPI00195BDAE4